MLKHRLLLFLCLLGILLGVRTSAGEVARPPLQERLKGETYQQRLAHIIAQQPSAAELEQSEMPVAGLEIPKIIPGSQAEQLGVETGDVLISVDGMTLWRYADGIPPRDGEQSYTFRTKEGQLREVRVQPGMFGIWYINYRRPDLWYVRHGQRNPAWDEAMLAAVYARHTDPALAETALWHAMQKGYQPDEFSDSMAAVIALYAGRPGDAEHYLRRLPAATANATYRPSDVFRARVALALGRYPWLVKLAMRSPKVVNPAYAQRLLVEWRRLGSPPPPDPRTFGQGLERVELDPPRVGEIDDEQVRSAPSLSLERVWEDEPFELARPSGSPRCLFFGAHEPVDNVELAMQFTLGAEPRVGRYAHALEILLLDWRYRLRHDLDGESMTPLTLRCRMCFAGLQIGRDPLGATLILIRGGHQEPDFFYTEPAFTLDPANPPEFEVSILRVGPWARIMLNGMPVALLPVEEEVQYPAPMLWVVGADADIAEVELFEIRGGANDAPPEPAGKPDTPRPESDASAPAPISG